MLIDPSATRLDLSENIARSASASSPTMSLTSTSVVRWKSNSRRPRFNPASFCHSLGLDRKC